MQLPKHTTTLFTSFYTVPNLVANLSSLSPVEVDFFIERKTRPFTQPPAALGLAALPGSFMVK